MSGYALRRLVHGVFDACQRLDQDRARAGDVDALEAFALRSKIASVIQHDASRVAHQPGEAFAAQTQLAGQSSQMR